MVKKSRKRSLPLGLIFLDKTLRTFSKAYGMAGARVGYGIAHEKLALAFNKVRNHFGVNRVGQALRMAASPLPPSPSALGAKLRRLKARLGPAKAIVAMARHLACLIYRMIKYGQDYVDEGLAACQARWEEQRRKRLEKQARELNLTLVEA